MGSHHLEPPRLSTQGGSSGSTPSSPTRASYASRAESEFISAYMRDSVALPTGAPSGSAESPTDRDRTTEAFASSRRLSLVDLSSSTDALGLGSPIDGGLRRRSSSSTRLADDGRPLPSDEGDDPLRQRSAFDAFDAGQDAFSNRPHPLYDTAPKTSPLPQGRFSRTDPFYRGRRGSDPYLSVRDDLGEGSSGRGRAGLYDELDDQDPEDERGIGTSARLTRFAELPAGHDPSDPRRLSASASGRLEEGWSKRKSRRRPSDAEKHPVSPLSRRGTLSAAAAAIRRASVRVVNLETSMPTDASRPDPDMDDKAEVEDPLHIAALDDGGTTSPPTPAGVELRGKSLGIFGPQNKLRTTLYKVFRHPVTEPLILCLIIVDTIVLTIQAAPNVYEHPRPTKGYFHTWEDWALFVLFCLFTVEMFARIIVAGLVRNSDAEERQAIKARPKSARPRSVTLQFIADKLHGHEAYALRQPGMVNSGADSSPEKWAYRAGGNESAVALKPSIVLQTGEDDGKGIDVTDEPTFPPKRSHTAGSSLAFPVSPTSHKKLFSDTPFTAAVTRQKTLIQTAYLRHSWNRIDCVAIVAFWISFALASTGVEAEKNVYIFRALSVLRAARLLTITAGTTTILRSLKRAGPLLVNVLYFIFFAGTLFSIVGVQSFEGSFLRSCVWIDPAGVSNFTIDGQSCGGHYDNLTGLATGFIQAKTGQPEPGGVKGFLCPQGQLCIENGDAFDGNPHNGTENFDNVGYSALQVVIIASANTYSNVMYSMMDAEYFASCFFFIVCLLLTNFWLFNILVAVLLNTFSDVVGETKHSAFAAGSAAAPKLHEDAQVPAKKQNFLRRWNHWAEYFWVLVILADFIMQATANARMSQAQRRLFSNLELGFTAALALDVVLRFLGYLPTWRQFFFNGKNLTDTFLAVITLIILIPPIRNSEVYPWLTFFQVVRFYRVILAVPRMKRLLKRLRGSFSGLVNMIIFLLGINFVASLIAVQYFRGMIPQSEDTEMTFYHMWNSLLAMYQIFSSENWTDVLYAGTAAEASYSQAWLVALFLAGWFVFANFILLQMFIAVISEGFAVPENEKHKEQLRLFIAKIEPEARTARWYAKLNPYKYLRTRPSAVAVAVHYANLPSNMMLPMRRSMVKDILTSKEGGTDDSSRFVNRARRAFRLDRAATMRARKKGVAHDDGVDLLAKVPARPDFATEGLQEAREAQAELIRLHPTYDKSLWIFSQESSLRKFCQSIVESSYGERLFGTQTNRIYRNVYQSVVFLAITGSVLVAAIATPPYQQGYYKEHGSIINTWFNWAEVALGTIFVVEFLIKIIADGFVFCPNAYLLSVWNGIDFFVLVTFMIDLSASLIFANSTSRLIRGLKAFRALRFINLSSRIRTTFFDVFITGFGSLFDASILTILYILPFGVWGMNIFSGLLYFCNDGDAQGKTTCLGEFVNAPRQAGFLMPRAWANPYVWSFDNFRSATLILFEIISLEGWIDVMVSLMSVTGVDQQPAQDASQSFAIYSLVYNLLGATVILTLFLTVIINNFLKRSGSAYLTTEQQQWINVRKLIYRQRPSRRPKTMPRDRFRQWCYNRAVQKQGWWSRMITALYIVHVALLMTQTRSNVGTWWDDLRDGLFLLFGVFYTLDLFIRLIGLGWLSFSQNGWNFYDIVVIAGTFATTIPLIIGVSNGTAVQLQKLFLVLIAFKLTVKSNSLNQLFKTAIASLPSIGQLFALWLILFLVWGLLYVEMFSLTRLGPNNLTRNSNYQTLPKALVMLVIQSTGEGWNGFMHDYTIEPPFCISSPNFLFDDCGSAGWAFALFISWNVISMYIILNMFTGVVVENFAFVFQLYGKVKAINREEVRQFKKVWADFDRMRTGYITSDDYIPFFARLTGVFDVSLYPPNLRIKALKAACSTTKSTSPVLPYGSDEPYAAFRLPKKGQAMYSLEGFNLDELRRRLSSVNGAEVRKRKQLLDRLYQEALITERPGRGMSFTAMMLLLAHYKLIDDQALQLEELVERKERLERVDDRVEFNRIHGIFQTVVARRRFLRYLDAKRRSEAQARGVPEIMFESAEASTTRGLPATFGRSSSSGSSDIDGSERPVLTLDLSGISAHHQPMPGPITLPLPPPPKSPLSPTSGAGSIDIGRTTLIGAGAGAVGLQSPGPRLEGGGGGGGGNVGGRGGDRGETSRSTSTEAAPAPAPGEGGYADPFSSSADLWREQ